MFDAYFEKTEVKLIKHNLISEYKELRYEIFVVKEEAEDEEGTLLGSARTSFKTSPVHLTGSYSDLISLKDVLPPSSVYLDLLQGITTRSNVDIKESASTAKETKDHVDEQVEPTHELVNKRSISVDSFDHVEEKEIKSRHSNLEQSLEGLAAAIEDSIVKVKKEFLDDDFFRNLEVKELENELKFDELEFPNDIKELSGLFDKSRSNMHSNYSSQVELKVEFVEEEVIYKDAVTIPSLSIRCIVESYCYDMGKQEESISFSCKPNNITSDLLRNNQVRGSKPSTRETTPKKKVRVNIPEQRRLSGSCKISQSGTTLEISIPLKTNKRTPTPAPFKSHNFFEGRPTKINSKDAFSIAGYQSKKSPAPKTRPTQSAVMAELILGKETLINRHVAKEENLKDNSSQRLSNRRGACSKLSLKVDIGNIYINSNDTDKPESSRSARRNLKTFSGERGSSKPNLFKRDSVELGTNRSNSQTFRQAESFRRYSYSNIPQNTRMHSGSTNRYRNGGNLISERRASVQRAYEEGIELVRRSSISQKRNNVNYSFLESRCNVTPVDMFKEDPGLADKGGFKLHLRSSFNSKFCQTTPALKKSIPIIASEADIEFITQFSRSKNVTPNYKNNIPRASLVQKVMSKLKIPTEKLKDPALIEQLERILNKSKKVPENHSKKLESLIKTNASQRSNTGMFVNQAGTSYRFVGAYFEKVNTNK